MIGGVGSTNNPLLVAMLSRLGATSPDAGAVSPASDSGTKPGSTDNALSGSGKAQLSDQILALLVQMQNSLTSSGASSTAATSSSTTVSPLSQLVSAIDTDGDGSISKSELETYIEGQGGTQAQADSLFAGLSQNGSGNLTTAQLQDDLQQASVGRMHGHGHGHHHHGGASANSVASQLMQAMDTNGDGSVSQSEFENFVTGLGGTTSEADADFAALDTQNSGGITTPQFSNAISAFQAVGQGQVGASPILSLLDDIAKNPAPATSV